MTTEEIIEKTRKVIADFEKHKFREGEYYDKYLFKMMKKHGIECGEYRIGYNLLKEANR